MGENRHGENERQKEKDGALFKNRSGNITKILGFCDY